MREALLFPRGLTERGRRDENDPALGHVHGPQVLHHAPQIRRVLVQRDVLLGVLVCWGDTDTPVPVAVKTDARSDAHSS